MDRIKAALVLAQQMLVYRQKSYSSLTSLVGVGLDVIEIENPDGHPYQIELQVVWDSKPGGDVRVLGAIYDGGWSAFTPLTDDFIMTPEGIFLGE